MTEVFKARFYGFVHGGDLLKLEKVKIESN
jgi:hypothetical protein